MSALLLDIQPGDEVIVPAYTFVATASAAVENNAIPVLVDSEPLSQGLDPADKIITRRDGGLNARIETAPHDNVRKGDASRLDPDPGLTGARRRQDHLSRDQHRRIPRARHVHFQRDITHRHSPPVLCVFGR